MNWLIAWLVLSILVALAAGRFIRAGKGTVYRYEVDFETYEVADERRRLNEEASR